MTVTLAQATSTLENVLFESTTLAAANMKNFDLSSYSSIDTFAQALTNTAEFSIVERVVSYYQDALGRTPSGVEIAYYVNLAESGSTAAGIQAATAAQIATGATGISNATWGQIAIYFAASQEFQTDYGVQANAVTPAGYDNLITSLYHNVLGRTASSAEIAYYDAALTAGASPSTLMQWFSESPEFQNAANPEIQAALVAYNNAILDAGGSNSTAITSHIGPPSYTISHDGQASITEGGTETFSVSTKGVSAGTTLYYTLTGVSASEVVGDDLSGTVTVDASGDASLTVSLTSGAGQGLSGNLTASISTSAGGNAVASSSEPLTETALSGIITLGNLGGGNAGTAPLDINNSGVIVGFSGIGGGGSGMFRSGSTGLDHAFIYQGGVMTDLGTLPGYSWQAEAWGVNNSGEVVGWSLSGGSTGTTGGHAFLWVNGAMTDLGALPGASISQARGINDFGQIVGQSGNDAFLWQPTAKNSTSGTMIDLGTLAGYQYAMAMNINASGEIIGYATNGDNSTMQGFLWTPTSINGTTGSMADLGALAGDDDVQPWAINASGEIVGTSTSGAGIGDAWIWTPTAANGTTGTMTKLIALGGAGCAANAYSINAAGEVAGMSQTSANGIYHATVWENGTAIDLNSLLPSGSGWVLTEADSINDSGLVTGQGKLNGVYATFEMVLPTSSVTSTAIHFAATDAVTLGSASSPYAAVTTVTIAAGTGAGSIYLSGAGSVIDASASTANLTLSATGLSSTVLGGTDQETITIGPNSDVTLAAGNTAANSVTLDQALGLQKSNPQVVTLGLHDGGSTIDVSQVTIANTSNPTMTAVPRIAEIVNAADGLTKLQMFSPTSSSADIIVSRQGVSIPTGDTFAQAVGLAVDAADSQAVANPTGLSSGGSHSYSWFAYGGDVFVVGHSGLPSPNVEPTDVIVMLSGLTNLQHFSIAGPGEILI